MRTIPAACALAAAGTLLLAPAAAPAFAVDSTYTVPLHQAKDLPITATSGGVSHDGDCPGIPDSQDGWHFVLPGNSTTFVKLTVTFQPGGTQVITSFGPPSDKHAYVASQAGAQLTSASAQVTGGDVNWFNLSHTCPASSTPTPSQSVSESPSPSPSESESESASPSPSQSVSESASPSPSGSTSPSESAPAGPSPSESPSGGLAETGAQVGGIAAVAVALLGAGAALVLFRKRAARRH